MKWFKDFMSFYIFKYGNKKSHLVLKYIKEVLRIMNITAAKFRFFSTKTLNFPF